MTQLRNRRIVHVTAQLRLGAGRYLVDTVVEQHRRRPHEVAVVLGDDADGPWVSASGLLGELRAHGIPVVRCGDVFHRDTSSLKAAAQRLQTLVGAWAPDAVVHAHTAMAAVVGRWAGAPTVVCTCHGWSLERPPSFDLQDAIAYSLCDAVTTPSAQWARVLDERASLPGVHLLPYGFDFNRYPPLARTDPANRPLRIVSVGELTARKGPDVLLDAMALLWRQHPAVELHVMGDGDRAGDVRTHAQAIDPSGSRVIFHGHVDAPYTRLASCDIFALASRSDNQPVAIIEAMLAGLPVASTKVGGIPDLIAGRCGYAVEPESAPALAGALATLIDAGAEKRRTVGAEGERYARRTFDVRRHVDALDTMYTGASPAVPATQEPRRPRTQFVTMDDM